VGDDIKEKEFIKKRVKALENSVRFFSPKAKEERERWIALKFLSFIYPNSLASDVQWVDAEPWDVLFLGTKTQIKEVQELGRKRHTEYKEALAKAKTAAHPSELFEFYTETWITITDAVRIALRPLNEWTNKYAPDVVNKLDLLVYLCIESNISMDALPDLSHYLNLAKWRSVSVVCNDCSFVLSARHDAPDFLRTAVGKVYHESV
jgi:hypothetical protein